MINYKKFMFAKRPLSFDFYAEDINAGFIPNTSDLLQDVEEDILAEELKASCTNVMLQCLDPESRCIYVLGLMFRADSKICGEILGITPETYRQRLTRIRKRVAAFLGEYCGLSGTGKCCCHRRIGYAVKLHRLDPQNLEYSRLDKLNTADTTVFTEAMEEMDRLADVFSSLPHYRSPLNAKIFLEKLISSNTMNTIKTEDKII